MWFAVDIDRCFQTGIYGTGIRLYIDSQQYVTIKKALEFKDGILKIIDSNNNIHTLNTQPDNKFFESTLYSLWKTWDQKNYDPENRTDYEPWAYDSLESLAKELKFNEKFEGKTYYNKSY